MSDDAPTPAGQPDAAAPPRLDHRRLRDRRGEGGVPGAAHRRLSRSGHDPPAARRDAGLRAWRGTSAGEGWARASVIKDAGDDPDVTHRAEIVATVRRLPPGAGVALQGRRRASAR